MAGRMLKHDGGEPLNGAERCTVYHDRTLLGSVRVSVLELETLRQVVIDLDCTQLPLASDRILDHEVKFRPVERGLAKLNDSLQPLLGRGVDDGLLRLRPVLVASDILLLVLRVTKRNLCHILSQVESLEHIENQIDDLLELLLELIRAAEEVGVVLGESADSRKSVKLTALLIAVDGAELRKTKREIAIGAR